MLPLVLCSGSPRRREFLRQLGLSFEVLPADIDETQKPGEPELAFVERLALEKAQAGLRLYGRPAVALAADTIVAVDHELLAKPLDRDDTLRMLRKLSGREHRVVTAVCVGSHVRSVETRVRFRELTEPQLRWLAESGDGDDKAGAYAVQGLAGLFIDRLEGSFTNVVGLPMAETIELLEGAGVKVPWA